MSITKELLLGRFFVEFFIQTHNECLTIMQHAQLELLDRIHASNVKANFWGFDMSDRFVV